MKLGTALFIFPTWGTVLGTESSLTCAVPLVLMETLFYLLTVMDFLQQMSYWKFHGRKV